LNVQFDVRKLKNNVKIFHIAIDVNDDAKICRLLHNALLVLIFWFYNHTNMGYFVEGGGSSISIVHNVFSS
jgi:hypothetical protein